MRRLPPLAFLAALAAHLLASPVLAQTRDVAGARDFPGIGRFAGSVITGYEVKDFDALRLQAAPFRDGKPADARRVEGRVTRIAYRAGPGPSILEVSRNFETQLAKAGFQTLLSCETAVCGDIPFVENIDALPIPAMWIDGFDYRYYAGRKIEEGLPGEVFERPYHPYTNGLLSASPRLKADYHYRDGPLSEIPGSIVSAAGEKGCSFRPRCPVARPTCASVVPQLIALPAGRQVACPYVPAIAEKAHVASVG